MREQIKSALVNNIKAYLEDHEKNPIFTAYTDLNLAIEAASYVCVDISLQLVGKEETLKILKEIIDEINKPVVNSQLQYQISILTGEENVF